MYKANESWVMPKYGTLTVTLNPNHTNPNPAFIRFVA